MLKVGIIGSGFGLYGLLPAFSAVEDCQVVALCGKQTERVLQTTQQYGVKNLYTDWQKMLQTEKLDAVAMAITPTGQFEVAQAAMKQDLHVFAEKPLAANLTQAQTLLQLAEQHHVTHGMDFIFPQIPAWQKTKELLEAQTFGVVKQLTLNWDFISFDLKNQVKTWKTDPNLGGGALAYYFSHSLYYLEYFFGKITQLKSVFVQSPASLNGGEVGVNLLLKFEDGVVGSTHLSCNTKGLHRHQLVIECEHGTLVLENEGSVVNNFHLTSYDEAGKIQEITIPGEASLNEEDERVKIVKRNATNFVAACLQRQPMTPSFADGVRVQTLIEQIRQQQL